jgi:hypothetical protein
LLASAIAATHDPAGVVIEFSAADVISTGYPTRLPRPLSMPLVGDVLCSAVVRFRSKRRIQRVRFQWVTTPLGDVLCPGAAPAAKRRIHPKKSAKTPPETAGVSWRKDREHSEAISGSLKAPQAASLGGLLGPAARDFA